MGLALTYSDGQTPLNDEAKEGLRIKTITTQAELDEHEQQNIQEAILWLQKSKVKKDDVLTERFIKELHKKMYGDTWSWAGKFRTHETNIGIASHQISTAVRQLLDDTLFWIANKTYAPEEIAIRFKHRLVSIHCFPNGNGRHSRLMADVIMTNIYGTDSFSWGHSTLVKPDDNRRTYITAIRLADQGEIKSLISFAKGEKQ